MKRSVLFCVIMVTLFLHSICIARAPHQVGGFELGKDIADYKEMLRMETSLPIRHMEYLREVEIKDMNGFRSGLIHYGTCAVPGRIVRIKLKYADSTKQFYEKLLQLFKKRFREPTEWRGDPFQVIIAWKWSFVDTENNRISLILQHNTKDEEEKRGNSVKLTCWSFIEEEGLCFEKKQPEYGEGRGKEGYENRDAPINWNLFIPR